MASSVVPTTKRLVATSIWLALTSAGAFAQQSPFFRVATTDDASQVFVWSLVQLKTESPLGTVQGLYRIAGGVATRVSTSQTKILGQGFPSNFSVSGDGRTAIWTEVIACSGGSSCIGVPPGGYATSYLTSQDAPPSNLGSRAQLSRNGRFLLLFSTTGATTLQDLVAGASWLVPLRIALGGRAVTSDGRVVGFSEDSGQLVLWSPNRLGALTSKIPLPAETTISDDARIVIYQDGDGNLNRIETSVPRVTQLGSGSGATLSNNGALAVFLQQDTCQVLLSDGSTTTSLLPPDTKAIACTVAGLGNAALALTVDGQILQIDLPGASAIQQIVPPTPLGALGGGLAPGALLTWQGQGHVRVLLNGAPMEVIRDIPGELWVQAPFDLPVNGAHQRIEIETASQFGSAPRDMPVAARAPYFFTSSYLLAAHDDFHGLVTDTDPASPGEVIHLWAVSLGAVSPQVAAGSATPLSPLTSLTVPFECQVLRGEGLPVLFAGLAPGMKAIYQVDVKLPDTLTAGLFLSCGTTGVPAEWGGGLVATIRKQ